MKVRAGERTVFLISMNILARTICNGECEKSTILDDQGAESNHKWDSPWLETTVASVAIESIRIQPKRQNDKDMLPGVKNNRGGRLQGVYSLRRRCGTFHLSFAVNNKSTMAQL